ncbi:MULTISPECIES: 30S ribosomal protein S12 methylthiotransferase RimO [unclassified Ruminococcus]|uniref:30S ribosomal protein S12 methylthiotransferase RimO n=1 Tax=unclassified Ruminococcus TaxID=2608920 RepID=UPI00210E071E|nr:MULTISPECIES: 30S ribosomal protein S12 methylthiotransferase RimO [unclassified Ruminococcus]MCQ4021983.1 30S ribosomal protein S12 methylthiotransferase RimO [Ruminococcus sp. zg-924]MCQ4114519.1 30S ribosomal protein S12 methylthiotransferase RimO [Ruminococcus sp. zg-921]
MSIRVGMVSLGCAKNQVDAEMLLFSLRQAGYQIVNEASLADVAIVNTCGFIEQAKQESIDEILELAQLKKEGKIKAIIVTGCLAERYKDEVIKELYEVDAVVGIGDNANIALTVDRVLNGEKVTAFPNKLCLPLEGGRLQSTPPYYAYLKISEGCDNCCTYCAIPLIRGKFRSRKMEALIDEANNLAEKGVQELIIIAQDTTRYGEDLYGKPVLDRLLRELVKIDKLKWIRLLYCYPDRITDNLLDTIAENDKILKYIDLPLQHCNKNVLKAMNRRGSAEQLEALIEKIRTKIPGVVLRTTLITGFPGESEQDFEELSEFVGKIKFERLGCFAYSREEGTPAAEMENQIDEEIKLKRQDIIMEQQQGIMYEYCQSLIGKSITVLCEGFDRYAECYFGRSAADSPDVDGKVFFTTNGAKPQPGDFVTVKIDDCLSCDPIGTME